MTQNRAAPTPTKAVSGDLTIQQAGAPASSSSDLVILPIASEIPMYDEGMYEYNKLRYPVIESDSESELPKKPKKPKKKPKEPEESKYDTFLINTYADPLEEPLLGYPPWRLQLDQCV